MFIFIEIWQQAISLRSIAKGLSGNMKLSQSWDLLVPKYICLICFHKWDQRIYLASERQCSKCKSRASYDYDEYSNVVKAMRWVITSNIPLRVAILQAAVIMSPLASLVRPGPLRIIKLWRKILQEAGVSDSELDTYIPM